MYSLDLIWKQILDAIQDSYKNEDSKESFMAYFNNSKLVELTEELAIITVEMKFNKYIINSQIDVVRNGFKKILDKDLAIRVICQDEYQPAEVKKTERIKKIDDNILPEFTFDNFVVGPSNQESYMAALACAKNPKHGPFNPLFIYGDSGLGKTHLLCSIGNYYKQNYPDLKVCYISSTAFVNEVVDSIKEKRIEEFKNSLNDLDLLLFDDIQNLSGKTKSNEVFFNIYNELYNMHKQIVISSDRSPSKIKDIEERLISRFQQGLTVTVSSPEYETACNIIKLKMKQHNIEENDIDEDVISFLATNFSKDVRALEGSLTRLLFYSINFSKNNRIDLDLAMEAFKDQITITKKNSNQLQADDIIEAVSDYYGLTKKQLLSKSRTKNIATARHIAMYLCRKCLDDSYIKIGEEFGGRDHSTVLSAYEKIDSLISKDESYKKVISDIENIIYS